MKTIITAATLGLMAFIPQSFAKDLGTMDPTGTWLTEDGRAKVRIEKCGVDLKEICGNISWLRDPLDDKGRPKMDIKNPDPAKRTRPTLGMPLLQNLKPDDDDVYSGEIYNAENGKMYDVTLKVEKPSDLHVKGCMLSILCGSQHWARVADIPATVVAQSQKPAKARLQSVAPSQ
ncbi:DUF2147 domain-containing protein [Lichenifustis flavocetrariae]|uniref:DUF2147 domain-containing protein n=1 Tax=Lichenifustis flavocetrariae TaxID=2949735 RepID=A0AA41Z2H8_9HYPH|nr:DUF2147 domain-containing protein [Lichenifustis flavocetrariae]MCW6508082.1 DUF2147 domain-containing protein [Lichenifustis flavocetrariae]